MLAKLVPAISGGCSRRVQEKKENSINIIAHHFKPQGGVTGSIFLLGTCCWPLRGPFPLLQCILMANSYTVKYLSTPGYKQTTNDL